MSETTSHALICRDVDPKFPVAERKTASTLLPNDCRWPYGGPAQPDFCFCGKQTADGGTVPFSPRSREPCSTGRMLPRLHVHCSAPCFGISSLSAAMGPQPLGTCTVSNQR
jgi:hypothetical protein